MFAMTVEDEDVPPVKANELETAFRKAGFNVHLIAKENDCGPEYTMVSLGGEINQKYMLTLQTSDRPKRLAQAGGWPKDADENLKRLESAGFKLDSGVPVCENCGKKGHIRKSCPEEKVESAFEQPKIK